MPIMPILTDGLTPASRWYVTRRSVAPGVSNAMGGPALALVRSDLNGYSIHHVRTVDRQIDLVRTYETLY